MNNGLMIALINTLLGQKVRVISNDLEIEIHDILKGTESVFSIDDHDFTVTDVCSIDFPSEYAPFFTIWLF